MQKGKFGFSLWFYPFISLWTVLVGPALASFLIALFVIAVEKDEWTSKQCLHVIMFNIYWSVYLAIMGFLSAIPLIGLMLAVLQLIIWIITMILILVMGLGRLKRGQDIVLPGKKIVERAYGLIQNAMPPQYQQQQHYQQQTYTQQTPPPPPPNPGQYPGGVQPPPPPVPGNGMQPPPPPPNPGGQPPPPPPPPAQ